MSRFQDLLRVGTNIYFGGGGGGGGVYCGKNITLNLPP